MARPKRESNTKTAREKISDAFWKLLAKGNYSDITISTLSLEAKVNHNTIYYYFDNIDHMARVLFDENFDNEVSSCLLSTLIGEKSIMPIFEISEDSSFYHIANRVRLFARGDSSYLIDIFKNSLSDIWLRSIGITKDQLNQADLIDIDFIFTGFTAIIGKTLHTNNIEDTIGIINRELGIGIIQTMNRLKSSYR